MTVKLFKAVRFLGLLLFLLLSAFYTRRVFASAENSAQQILNNFALFAQGTTQIEKKSDSSKKTTYQSFTSPSFAFVNDVLVVFAQAKNITNGKVTCDIVESYAELKDAKSGDLNKFFTQPTNTVTLWKIRAITENVNNCTESPSVIVNQSNIYVFFKNATDTVSGKWEYNLINGIVNDGGTKSISWVGSVTNITDKLKKPDSSTEYVVPVGGGGPGIVVNKTMTFPLGHKKDDANNISTIITNTSSDGKEWKLVSSTASAEGTHPVLVEWEGKLIMLTFGSGGARKVYESTDMGEKWTEAVGSISNVWGNTKGREPNKHGVKSGFITAEIEEGRKKTKVILFTQAVGYGEESSNKYKLHLWLTDYKRVYDVGVISGEVGNNISSTLLYAKGSLFAAYEQWNNGNCTINITHLQDELEIIKKTLELWETEDALLSKSCFAADGTLTTGNTCTNKIPTNGLVGYLSSNYSNNNWVDKYLCVNATVHNEGKVTSVSGGGGAGAVWPVGAQGQNQRYHFANCNFTLLATVTINDDAANVKGNSVLGVTLTNGGDNTNKRIGLWCGREGKWGVGDSAESTKISTGEEKCEKGKTYVVALIMKDKTVNAYIDGKLLSSPPSDKMKIDGSQNVTHFYFGADNGDNKENNVDSHVTVRNVLLYNFPFSDDDIKKLNIPVVVQEDRPQKPPSNDTPADTAAEDTGTSSNAPQSPEDIKNDDEGERTTSQSENSAVRGCASAAVFLVFWGVCGRTLYEFCEGNVENWENGKL